MFEYSVAESADRLHLVGGRRVAYVSVLLLLLRGDVVVVGQGDGRAARVMFGALAGVGVRSFELESRFQSSQNAK